jgi:hypothetical protein
MSDELKPCPFCGGDATEGLVFVTEVPNGDMGWVGCVPCGVFVNYKHGESGRRAAMRRWNSYAEYTCRMNHVLLYDEMGIEGIECDECGWSDIHPWDDPLPDRCPGCDAKVVG